MKFNSHRFIEACFLCLIVFLFGSNALADVPVVRLISAPFGHSSYVIGSAIEDISKKYYKEIHVLNEEGMGLPYNIKKNESASPEDKKNTAYMSADATFWLAHNGKGPFKKKMGQDFRVLTNVGVFSSWFMTFDPGLKSMGDLVGKSVGIGKKNQQSYGQFLWYYLTVGWDLEEKTKINWMGSKAAEAALKDGLVDACPAAGYVNPVTKEIQVNTAVLEMAAFKKVYFLSPGEEALKKITQEVGLPVPYITIPAASIEGNDRPITTHASRICWAASIDMSEDLAYHFTKLMIQYTDKLKDYHAVGKLMTRESLAFGWKPEEFHPGALKAFKEAGLIQ